MTKPISTYHWKLLAFLSVSSFFEGYDFIIVSQLLPHLRQEWGLDRPASGLLITVINAGTVAAYFVVRLSDRLGRRRMLMATILGYAACTFLSGLAQDPVSFAAAQFSARLFLTAEWVTAMVYAAEEFPAERRATMIGIISAFASLGAIVCAGAMPLLLQGPWQWRTAYFVGILPLILIAYARRNIRETRRFQEQAATTDPSQRRSFFYIWTTPYRGRLIQLAIIWGCCYVSANVAIQFWADFALNERGLSTAQIGTMIAIAAVCSAPLLFFAGKVIDVLGRRKSAVIFFSMISSGIVLSYTLSNPVLLVISLWLAIFGLGAYLPLLNAYTSELFPTDIRSDAFAWANNLLGRITFVFAPTVVGWYAVGGWSDPVRFTAVFPVIAMLLILWWLPETSKRELEVTSSLPREN